MTGVRTRGEDVRKYILTHIEKHPANISKITAEHFGITRQAVNKHLQKLTTEKALAEKGNTRNRSYTIVPLSSWIQTYRIAPGIAEDLVWRNDISPTLNHLPDNVLNIWHYGFTEMFNNAIDHSGGVSIIVKITKTAADTQILIRDDGIGIFKKIQAELGLLDERHAVFELAKGKLTTDPQNHSGEGIFFSSRMFDSFTILSGGVWFNHKFGTPEDWILDQQDASGTTVFMKLHNHTARKTKKIFNQYSSGDEYGFTKTVVPVRLAQYGAEALISRSQAKRLLARIELFKKVLFDFKEVQEIGQAFADEIFRVFANQHPEIELQPINYNVEIKQMIQRARAGTGAIAQ